MLILDVDHANRGYMRPNVPVARHRRLILRPLLLIGGWSAPPPITDIHFPLYLAHRMLHLFRFFTSSDIVYDPVSLLVLRNHSTEHCTPNPHSPPHNIDRHG
ncbi:hypothetical protein J6590_009234 [Homalodisca vitripennis]|nr:hypothetical protein J6590_009234 [Homalodisca vitripennis]